jgi:lysyl-tRNA synthetase class 2
MPSHVPVFPGRPRRPRRPSRRSRLSSVLSRPAVLGVAVALVGVVGIASALTPSLPRRLGLVEGLVDPEAVHLAAGTTALVGFVLLLLGRGIARRRHAAYLAAVVLLVLSAITHLVKGFDLEETMLAVAVAVLLVRGRAGFAVRTPPGRVRRIALLVAGLVVVDLAVGVVAVVLGERSRLRVPVRPGRLLLDTVHLLGGAGSSAHFHGLAHLVPLVLVLLGFASAGAVLLVALAPAAHEDADGVTAVSPQLVNRRDGDTLDPFARRSDKHLVWSSDGGAALAYRVVAGVGLASGDPVGAPEAFPEAVRAFVAHCDRHGWRPALLGVRGDRVPMYVAAGLRTEYLGDEAIVEVAGFALDGRAMRGVRQAVNRTRSHGITTEFILEGDLDAALRDELRFIAERGRAGAPERGFSMALDGLLSGRDTDCLVVIARDATGLPFAFQRYVPCRGGQGLSLDAMRRDRDRACEVPNGVNERLIVDTIDWARTHGVSVVSLNFAFGRALVDDDAGITGPRKAQAWCLRKLGPWFQIESLLRFNAKFAPVWVPRYLVYRSIGDLPAVAAAAAGAEGFLPIGKRNLKSAA